MCYGLHAAPSFWLHLTSHCLSFTHWLSCLSLPLSCLLTLFPSFPALYSPSDLSPPPLNLPCPFRTSILLLRLAAVAGGGMTARRATATGGTNTRRARGARRAKRPVRISEQTKRTRRAWSSDHRLLLVLLLCPSPTTNKKQKGEDETKKTRKSQWSMRPVTSLSINLNSPSSCCRSSSPSLQMEKGWSRGGGERRGWPSFLLHLSFHH